MKKIETKSLVLLKHHLKALRMPTLLAECEKVAGQCATDNIDHLGFLLRLCELELIDRERRASDRRLKAAQFPNHKTLDSFDFHAQPSLNKLLITELLRGEYLDKKENVLLVGNSGTGKSHIATALGIAACGQGKRVKFVRRRSPLLSPMPNSGRNGAASTLSRDGVPTGTAPLDAE